MQFELMIALVGVGGTLAGVITQGLITGSAARRDRYVAVQAKWGEVLAELFDAGSTVERWVGTQRTSASPEEGVAAMEAELDHAFDRVILECPLELSRPATKFVQHAYALLEGKSDLERLDEAKQNLYLVYRHIGGINDAIARRHGGRRALKDVATD